MLDVVTSGDSISDSVPLISSYTYVCTFRVWHKRKHECKFISPIASSTVYPSGHCY